MNAITRMLSLVSLLSSFAVFALFSLPPTQVAAASSCQAFPGNSSCTGQDPQRTGCEADAYTLTVAEVTNTLRAAVRYSPTCRSAWARAVNLTTISGSRITAGVVRSDGTAYSRLAIYPTTAVTSPMVYIGNGASAKATATLQTNSGSIISLVQTGFARP